MIIAREIPIEAYDEVRCHISPRRRQPYTASSHLYSYLAHLDYGQLEVRPNSPVAFNWSILCGQTALARNDARSIWWEFFSPLFKVILHLW